jgi:hypothetical protein
LIYLSQAGLVVGGKMTLRMTESWWSDMLKKC